MDTLKRCSTCGDEKSLTEFHNDKNGKNGKARLCKVCACLKSSKWHISNPEKARAARSRYQKENKDSLNLKAREYRRTHPEKVQNSKRLYRYGITEGEYEVMLQNQNGVCMICGRPPKKNRLNLDHSHTTGKIRDLLCIKCNGGLGYFNDDPSLMLKAVEYLFHHMANLDGVYVNEGFKQVTGCKVAVSLPWQTGDGLP